MSRKRIWSSPHCSSPIVGVPKKGKGSEYIFDLYSEAYILNSGSVFPIVPLWDVTRELPGDLREALAAVGCD